MRNRVLYYLPIWAVKGIVALLVYLGMFSRKFKFVGSRVIQFTLPSGCDHDCTFCITDTHGKGSINGREVLSYNEIATAAKSAIDNYSLYLNLVSKGEPLLYPQLQNLIEYITSYGRGRSKVKLITNGTSIEKLGVDFFIKHKVNFWVGLHAGDFETWKSIHRPLHNDKEKFESLKKNLKILSKSKNNHVHLHFVLTNVNYNKILDMMKISIELNANEISFGRLYEFPDQQLDFEMEEKTLASLKNNKHLLKEARVKHNIDSYETVAFLTPNVEEESSDDKNPPHAYYENNDCYMSWLMSFIDDEGQYSSCIGGKLFSNIKKTNFAAELNLNEASFRRQSVNISRHYEKVSGCNCDECPHISMNTIANKYLP